MFCLGFRPIGARARAAAAWSGIAAAACGGAAVARRRPRRHGTAVVESLTARRGDTAAGMALA
jgi:hypothetical protein